MAMRFTVAQCQAMFEERLGRDYSTTAGTLVILGCSDAAGTNTYALSSVAVAANSVATTQARVLTRWWRAQFVCGATGGAINLVSSATA